MSSFAEAYERIKFSTNTKTQVELAEVLDIRQSSISDAKKRNSVPAEWFMKLFEKFGLNPDWLKQGVGPMYLRTEQGYEPQEAPTRGLAEEAWHYGDPSTKSTMVTVHSMSCEYTEGGLPPLLPQVGKISLPLAFATPSITVVRMDATNMEPSIGRGAYMGVDITTNIPISGSVFALYSPHEGIIIKRLFLSSDTQSYILRSDKDGYPESSVKAAGISSRIMGRVTWVLQEI